MWYKLIVNEKNNITLLEDQVLEAEFALFCHYVIFFLMTVSSF